MPLACGPTRSSPMRCGRAETAGDAFAPPGAGTRFSPTQTPGAGVLSHPFHQQEVHPMAVQTRNADILAEDNREKREHIIQLLTKAYWMEIETVINYVA